VDEMKRIHAQPSDFIGSIIYTMLKQRMQQNPNCPPFHTWQMKVVLSTDYYPLSLIFDNGLEFHKGDLQEADIRLDFSFEVLLEIIKGRKGFLGAILRRGVRIEGFLKHPFAAYRFYKLMSYIIEV